MQSNETIQAVLEGQRTLRGLPALTLSRGRLIQVTPVYNRRNGRLLKILVRLKNA